MIRRVLNKLQKMNALSKGMHVHLDFPASEKVRTPYLKATGFVVSKEAVSINKIEISIGDSNYKVREIQRPDLVHVFDGFNKIGFQIVIWPKEDWASTEKLTVRVNNDEALSIDCDFDSSIITSYFRNRERKLNAIKQVVSSSLEQINGAYLGMSQAEFDTIEETGNVSDHDYDKYALSLIEKHKNGLILDAGAGLRSVYYPNVVNAEVVDYPTTDVLAFADKLPFQDNSFEAVFSLNVLEHVPNPFTAAKELHRVLKPGGDLYVAVPFLQPFHGYPNHYYNMTTSGLKGLFSEGFKDIDCGVLEAGHPIYALSWMLNSYAHGLNESNKNSFMKLTVEDLINAASNSKQDWIEHLSEEAKEELSCVNYITAQKL